MKGNGEALKVVDLVYLSKNNIGDEGGSRNRRGIKVKDNMTDFILGSNKIGAEGARHRRRIENTTLIDFISGSNKIGS